MAETKQKTGAKPSKQKKQRRRQNGNGDEPTKEEYAVAKYVRFKCPTKKTVFGGSGGDEVHYFVGSKAVDFLMESKWSSKKSSKKPALFTDRQSCVDYMQELLMKGLFFRAKKLVPKLKEKPALEAGDKKKDKNKKGAEIKETQKSPKAEKEVELKRRGKEKVRKEEEEKAVKEKEKDKDDDDNDNDKGKEKKGRKVRLDFHNEQLFIDGPSTYVWKYDPTPLTHILLGLGIVVGAIALCLFPLWPLQLRAGVYYLSLGAMGFLGAFIGLVVIRHVIFGLVWVFTVGRHHFWLLPNLTEDCGILESFKPLYSYKHVPSGAKPVSEKKKKDKKSDSEDEGSDLDKKSDESEDEDGRDQKDAQTDDQVSESGSENEEGQVGEGDSVTASQDEENEEKSDESSQNRSTRTSTDEEIPVPKQKTTPKKRRAMRRDEGQETNNGDFEIVERPNK